MTAFFYQKEGQTLNPPPAVYATLTCSVTCRTKALPFFSGNLTKNWRRRFRNITALRPTGRPIRNHTQIRRTLTSRRRRGFYDAKNPVSYTIPQCAGLHPPTPESHNEA